MYSGSRLADLNFAYGAFTLSGWLSQNHSAILVRSIMRSEPHGARTMVWALPVSLAATPGIDVSFSSSGYLDVSVHRVPLHALCIHAWIHEVCSCGFPHSDICGSMDICSSPQLFAAYHVFLRLLVPRHPPCALLRLTNFECLDALPRMHSVACIGQGFVYLLVFHDYPPSSDGFKDNHLGCLVDKPLLRIRALANRFARSSIFFEYRLPAFHLHPHAHKCASAASANQSGYSLHDSSDICSVCGFQGTYGN